MAIEVNIRPERLGARLKAARVAKRLKQDAVGSRLGVARTTVVAIEAGKRAVSSSELRALAELYDLSEGDLLDEERPDLDLTVDFRSSTTADEATDEAIAAAMLQRLATSTLALEALVGQKAPRLDLPQVTISKTGSLAQQAEDAALALRTRLGIGLGPIQDMTSILEFELGLRVYERPLPSKVSGAVAYDDNAGGFVLLNSRHPLSRRRVTAGHEAGHALVRKQGVSVLLSEGEPQEREERFFDLFGIAFLTPATAVRRKAEELERQFSGFNVRQLLMMAVFFNVSIEAMTRRMVQLGLLGAGTFERLKGQGVGLKHRAQVALEMREPEPAANFTPCSLLVASIAYQRGLLSQEQIASMLELDLLTVRVALEEGIGDLGDGNIELSL